MKIYIELTGNDGTMIITGDDPDADILEANPKNAEKIKSLMGDLQRTSDELHKLTRPDYH